MLGTTATDRGPGVPRRVARAGAVAWALAGGGLGLAALFIGTSAHRWPTATALAGVLALVLAVRTARAGVYVERADLRCATWWVTHRVPLDEVTRVRAIGYPPTGAARRRLAVLAIERGPRRVVVLRALVGPVDAVGRVAARVDALRSAPGGVAVAAAG
jgi:hypothetical protein